ncbi:MAG: hypothetical protein A2Y62_13420 [Candidatus Fischerbacteria bacterium RBG_13_37_8]|uniref:Fibronectin type-III domain-containing protein n=1 Tax=Candidatus Fischerbacteria bacterium RBG_13_37_8 TaxID=1817863 RepID=A0A1F5VK68_9BACT|nr:MAG: hypothetical protein A2Y62_13420 [Candidatus Fischerbacteria bacterium RBG_13_37_8]
MVVIVFFLCLMVGVSCFGNAEDINTGISSSKPNNDIAFEERAVCEKQIQQIYWERIIWPKENGKPKPGFNDVVDENAIHAKVADMLRKSNALEHYWQKPITAEQLQAELERMARETRMPEVLKALWSALHNDPHLIAECLARPMLVDRLIRDWYSTDERFHGELKERALNELRKYAKPSQMKLMNGEYSEMEWVCRNDSRMNSKTGYPFYQDQRFIDAAQFEQLSISLAQLYGGGANGVRNNNANAIEVPIGVISELQENSENFFAITVLEKRDTMIRIATASWRKVPFDQWWHSIQPNFNINIKQPAYKYTLPAITEEPCVNDTWSSMGLMFLARINHSSIWTGTEMIIWGGTDNYSYFNTGARYNPGLNTWSSMSVTNAPSGRIYHTAVWTGTEMIIWGGKNASEYFNTGGRYNVAGNLWTPLELDGAPAGRALHSAVWTGGEMIIWGGEHGIYENTGSRYNPSTDTWSALPASGAPDGRSEHTAVWSGDTMIVWGGWNGNYLNTGGRYYPSTDSWLTTSMVNAPAIRRVHSVVWTGSEMIIWGGFCGITVNSGARYNPETDIWVATSLSNAPAVRMNHSAVWTGSEMIVWGGKYNTYTYLKSGSKYFPSTDSWTSISETSAPAARASHTAVWTGAEMIVWGGYSGSNKYNNGGRFQPLSNTWTPLNIGTATAPEAREYHTAVWIGFEMIVWGGYGFGSYFNTGGRYNAALSAWIPISTINAPLARYDHKAVWTGTEMIIWGGTHANWLATGGKYNPITDTWASTSLQGAPPGRVEHTAVWTGTEMIVWGGWSSISLDTGARYNPASDSWTPMATGPYKRIRHTAVWTGTEMIIWGGCCTLNSGSRYNPELDLWQPISEINAPAAVESHSAVWTGNEMIIWGGTGFSQFEIVGGRYNPATDTWLPVSINGAPEKRELHAAVWTGSEMIIWGGHGYQMYNNGGRYFPDTDTWTLISIINAPSPRFTPVVWAGQEMIVWGGYPANDSGGKYCGCPTEAPSSVTVSQTGPHEVTVTWSPLPGAISYNVYRKYLLCGNEREELIATNITDDSFVVDDVSGDVMYHYSVAAKSASCLSPKGSWISLITRGNCTLMPCFDGIQQVTNNATGPCSVELSWNTAVSSCATFPELTYAIYRSADPYFVPSDANLVADCVTGNSYTDNNIASGATLYYIVRAEDSGAEGDGPCNSGNLDDNIKKKAVFPTGPVSVLFSDDFENGLSQWTVDYKWHTDNDQSHSGIYSAHAGNFMNQCPNLIMANNVVLPSYGYNKLSFWTTYDIYDINDGGVVEVKSSGTSWRKLPLIPDYPGWLETYASCFSNEYDFQSGFNLTNIAWQEYTSDLSSYSGKGIKAKFVLILGGGTVPPPGWRIDDFQITNAATCLNGSPNCTSSPIFSGIISAKNAETSPCKILLNWAPAASTCVSGPNISYHIYKSADPNFQPSEINRIASCITGTTFVDTNVIYGTPFYYIVRSEDSTGNGNGPCNHGNIDTNIVKKGATASGQMSIIYQDDFESATGWANDPSNTDAETGFFVAGDPVETKWQVGNDTTPSPGIKCFYTAENPNGEEAIDDVDYGKVTAHSPVIDLSIVKAATLSYNYFFGQRDNEDDKWWDWFRVDISNDGGTIYPVNLEYFGNQTIEPNWTYVLYDLSSLLPLTDSFRMRIQARDWGDIIEAGIDDVIIKSGSFCQTVTPAPGTVPDNDNFHGTPLTIKKYLSYFVLSWGAPLGTCQTEDYGIYRGELPWSGYNHRNITCTTGGNTWALIPAGTKSFYYLVVAQNNGKEGSYGLDSSDAQRPQAQLPCYPLEISYCN